MLRQAGLGGGGGGARLFFGRAGAAGVAGAKFFLTSPAQPARHFRLRRSRHGHFGSGTTGTAVWLFFGFLRTRSRVYAAKIQPDTSNRFQIALLSVGEEAQPRLASV